MTDHAPTPLWCPLPITNRRRAYTPSHETDITRTWAEHSTHDLEADKAGEQQEEAAA